MTDVHPQIWMHNFSSSVAAMIFEYQRNGYVVKAVQMSPSIYNKMANIMGRDPDNICGFIIEIIGEDEGLISQLMREGNDEPDDDDIKEYVGIRAEPIC